MVFVDGRGRKRSPSYDPDTDMQETMPATVKELREEIRRLRAENARLENKLKKLGEE